MDYTLKEHKYQGNTNREKFSEKHTFLLNSQHERVKIYYIFKIELQSVGKEFIRILSFVQQI